MIKRQSCTQSGRWVFQNLSETALVIGRLQFGRAATEQVSRAAPNCSMVSICISKLKKRFAPCDLAGAQGLVGAHDHAFGVCPSSRAQVVPPEIVGGAQRRERAY